jgi:hypothetical protein
MTVPSLSNFVYYFLFTDDYSRKTWIYFLKTKDDVFNKFQEFKALVENLFERKITVLRSNNGGECYPRYLGITRRSCLEAHMVLDMEYREQERPEHGPGGPIFFFSASFVLPAVPASITTGLGLHQKRLLLHEVIGLRYHGMCHI